MEGVVERVHFVANSRAKSGGPCEDCGDFIEKGQPIFKYPLPKEMRSSNGPGIWVCFWCAVDQENGERQLKVDREDDEANEVAAEQALSLDL